MKNYGMMMVCGNSIEELEQSVAAMKMAMATGATMGCGGSSLAEIEMGMEMLRDTVPTPLPLLNPCPTLKPAPKTVPGTEERVGELERLVDLVLGYLNGEIDEDELADILEELR